MKPARKADRRDFYSSMKLSLSWPIYGEFWVFLYSEEGWAGK